METLSYDILKSVLIDASTQKYKPSVIASSALYMAIKMRLDSLIAKLGSISHMAPATLKGNEAYDLRQICFLCCQMEIVIVDLHNSNGEGVQKETTTDLKDIEEFGYFLM